MAWPVFPNAVFAWGFYLALVVLTGVAAYFDLRKMTVPKWVTLGGLGAGIVVNVVRGAWLGSLGEKTWLLSPDNAWLGALDGFLFSLAGFLLAFVTLFILWFLGTCGGGDVKLFSTVGAWVGAGAVIWVFAGSLVTLVGFIIVWVCFRGLSAHKIKETLKRTSKSGGYDPKPGKFRVTYSLPIAVATALVLLWGMRVSLQLVPATQPSQEKVQAHVH